jgi:flagellin
MIINHNMSALYANRVLKFQNWEVNKNIEKLSSGMRINKAGDDASGLAVSEKLRSQIRGLNQAERNIENAVSFIQVSEGYLAETHDILHRIRELAVQSANGIYSDEDRMQIQVEVSQLVDEVNRIASHAQFNGMNILTGAFANPEAGGLEIRTMYFQVGANMDQRERVFIGTMTSQALGLQGTTAAETISISTPERANMAIGLVDGYETVSSARRPGRLPEPFRDGRQGGRSPLRTCRRRSRSSGTDMAAETVQFVKNNILVQPGRRCWRVNPAAERAAAAELAALGLFP